MVFYVKRLVCKLVFGWMPLSWWIGLAIEHVEQGVKEIAKETATSDDWVLLIRNNLIYRRLSETRCLITRQEEEVRNAKPHTSFRP